MSAKESKVFQEITSPPLASDFVAVAFLGITIKLNEFPL